MRKKWSMMIVAMATCCSLLLLNSACSKQEEAKKDAKGIMEVDFDLSMGKGLGAWNEADFTPDDSVHYSLLKENFEKNKMSKVSASTEPKIPKIIHQIWVGPKTPPSYFFVYREKWLKMHPGWEYHLWTDADLDNLNLEMRDIFDASTNYGEKSDILRSEILERFGGVYIDDDFDPHVALDELHYKYDYYSGLECPHKICTNKDMVWPGISIIAACPHHPIIKQWKESIRANWEKVNATISSPTERVNYHTFLTFQAAVFDKLHEGNYTNMILPTTYFYPLTEWNASKQRASVRKWREKFYGLMESLHLKSIAPFSRNAPETIATHLWGGTWQSGKSEQLHQLQQQLDILKRDFYTLQQRLHQAERAKPVKEAAVAPAVAAPAQ